MICWHCHWGWPENIANIYLKALSMLSKDDHPLLYGPAHIVWSDENFYRENIQWCLDNFNEYRADYNDKELEVVKWSLLELLKIPGNIDIEPEDYDGMHPELYPPPNDIKMIKI